MTVRIGAAGLVFALVLTGLGVTDAAAQPRIASAKSLRCSFPRNATGSYYGECEILP